MAVRVQPSVAPMSGMAWIAPGGFAMGSGLFYAEERPVRRVEVNGFWIDRHPVTVREFRRFVAETGYRTLAERTPEARLYPDADPDQLVAGSLVFRKPRGRVPLSDVRRWWAYVPGACWHHPEGAHSDVAERARHPVVHVAYEDARAFAVWSGKALPTEAEWEYAARGGLDGAVFAWGDDPRPGGRLMANTWQGEFPWKNTKANGYEGTSPVGVFPPNGYGLYDITGNVWEWTADAFALAAQCDAADTRQQAGRHDRVATACCSPRGSASGPRAQREHVAGQSDDAPRPDGAIPMQVIKGGSHLCAPNYCLRYRPAARQAEAIDTSTAHLGFRCVVRA
jgi:formylglycine-generating enzyme